MFSLLSSLKSYFTGETPPVEAEAETEAETPAEKEGGITTEPTFKTEVEVKVPEKPKIPIYAFGQKAPYYIKNFEVSRVDLEGGETMRASLLHSWMYQEGFIDKMTKAHVEVPIIKRIPDPGLCLYLRRYWCSSGDSCYRRSRWRQLLGRRRK